MIRKPTMELAGAKVNIVSRYFTPLAVLIIANGIILTSPPSPLWQIASGLLAFSYLFNHFSTRWVERDPQKRGFRILVRVYTNLAVNAAIVYLIGEYWTPVWLLLLLSPIATAIYGSLKQTLISALLGTLILMLIAALRPGMNPLLFAEQANYGMYIILLSLGIFKLVRPTEVE